MVAYVNTSADIKAETDVCCTSANAVQIVDRFPKDQKIIFVPDRNLGDYVARQTGREETMILWQGWCHVHDDFRAAEIDEIRAANPGSVLMAHPESRREVLEIADVVTSTSGMLRYPETSDARTFVVATETGLLYRLGAALPGQEVHPGIQPGGLPEHEAHRRSTSASRRWATSGTTCSSTRSSSPSRRASRRSRPSSGCWRSAAERREARQKPDRGPRIPGAPSRPTSSLTGPTPRRSTRRSRS